MPFLCFPKWSIFKGFWGSEKTLNVQTTKSYKEHYEKQIPAAAEVQDVLNLMSLNKLFL